jgi:hypothetical protein
MIVVLGALVLVGVAGIEAPCRGSPHMTAAHVPRRRDPASGLHRWLPLGVRAL